MAPASMSVNIDIHQTQRVGVVEHIDVAVIGVASPDWPPRMPFARQGLQPVVLEASQQAAGSWP